MTEIHPTAIIEDGAQVGKGCRIGPYCHVGKDVVLGCNNELQSHVVIDGLTQIGDDNLFFPFACIGKVSQDLKYRPEWTCYTRIGNGNTFREYVTVNAASIDREATIIGDHNLFLSYSHVAHDCIIGNHVIISTDSKLAGHVQMDDHAILNAKSGVVQFIRIGRNAFIGGFNKVTKDILPFCIADGSPSVIRAINKIGLERKGFEAEDIAIIQDGYKSIIRSGRTLVDATQHLEDKYPDNPHIQEMITFARSTQAGLARPKNIRSKTTEG